MQDWIVGVLAVVVGALFCFRGYLTMRLIIPIWGAFAGFLLGAGLVASAGDDGLLRTGLGWLVGVAVGLLFGLIAYAYYEISVLFAMAAIGFSLGASTMVALGVRWNWVIVLVGMAVAAALALVAIIGDLPMLLLTVLSALGGASVMVGGVMLLAGTADTADFTVAEVTERIEDSWWWWALYAVLVVVGIATQLRTTAELERSLRAQWTASGGRELRPGS